MVQERAQFGAEPGKDESRGSSDKQLRTFATKFMIVKDTLDPEFKEDLKKLTFRLCYFSQCPRSGLGANRLPLVITYARRLEKYVRCSCQVGAQSASGKRETIPNEPFDRHKNVEMTAVKEMKSESLAKESPH